MKRIVLVITVIVMVASTTVCCFATYRCERNEGVPIYESLNNAYSQMAITDNKANYNATLRLKKGDDYNRVNATLKILNKKGKLIKSKNTTMNPDGGYISIEDSASLTERGTYHAEYIFKIYKSGKLVETLTGKSNSVTY